MAHHHRGKIRNMTLFQALISQGCAIEAAMRIANAEDTEATEKPAQLPPYDEPKPSASLFAWR